MSLVKWAFIIFVTLPAAEIGAFILVALMIGWLWTVVLFLATSLVGIFLLRRYGRNDLNRFRDALASDGLRAVHLETPGFAAMFGGILLVFPGFITDLLGAALLVPSFRRWAGAALRNLARRRRRGRHDAPVIDLEPDQWHRLPDHRPKGRRKSKRRA
jgi:UPF0716 protein FxsA